MAHATWRQRLHYFTGDRSGESKALADSIENEVGPIDTSQREAIDGAAKDAVRDAHGEGGIAATEHSAGDIAMPSEVIGTDDRVPDPHGDDPALGGSGDRDRGIEPSWPSPT